MKVCSTNSGHVTKVGVMPISGKNPLKIRKKDRRLMTFKLGIQHQELRPYKVCSNDDL